jgi:hypothetical protein
MAELEEEQEILCVSTSVRLTSHPCLLLGRISRSKHPAWVGIVNKVTAYLLGQTTLNERDENGSDSDDDDGRPTWD